MSGRSPNFIPRSQFLNESPARNRFPHRQPLHLPPNSPFMSPRSYQTPSPRGRPSSDNNDFIPLGISSPVNRPRSRQSWNRGSYSNSSSYSTYSTSSTPSSFNSSHGPSPYKRHNNRGHFRGRNAFNNSRSGSPPIHLYCDKEALEDPWAELSDKLERRQANMSGPCGRSVPTSEGKAEDDSSGSEVSDDADKS